MELELGMSVEKLVERVEVEVTSASDDSDRMTWPVEVAWAPASVEAAEVISVLEEVVGKLVGVVVAGCIFKDE